MMALQFMTQFRHAEVLALGCKDNLCWAVVEVDIDGTETQGFFVMERDGSLRTIQNLSGSEVAAAAQDPLPFWDHPRATVE